jgi:shikimate dehydrogenase
MSSWFQPQTSADPYFCVVGSPVGHSKSPLIHQAFAAQLGLSLIYDRVEVAAGSLGDAVAEFRRCGGVGMNITVPLKAEAWALAQIRNPRAELAGAANTLWFNECGNIMVDNTDGVGLVRDLRVNYGLDLGGLTILLLGAGGAARGVVPSLLQSAPRKLLISNRTALKAEAIAAEFAALGEIQSLPWGMASSSRPDLIINATALSLNGQVPPLVPDMVSSDSVCYDLMYSVEPTPFVAWSRAEGARLAVDGLGMLVEQAAEAFFIWHGLRPDTRHVIEMIRAA